MRRQIARLAKSSSPSPALCQGEIQRMTPERIIGTYRERADAFISEAADHGLAVIIVFVRNAGTPRRSYSCTGGSVRSCMQVVTALEFEAQRIRADHEAGACCCGQGGIACCSQSA